MDNDNRKPFAGLVGYAYPAVEPVGARGERFSRRWIVRCTGELPREAEVNAVGTQIAETVQALFRSTYESTATEDQLLMSMPKVSLGKIDEYHCVAEIEAPTAGYAVGNAAAIGTWTTLRAIDEAYGIEDLQGLPKRMWFQLK
jgi:hypothetical protein